MLSSTVAYSNSLTQQTLNATRKVADEIIRLEGIINKASGVGAFQTGYNALVVGNPAVDVENHDGLTELQLEFLTILTDTGYVVSRDPNSGWWVVDWSQDGPEEVIKIYTIRTTLAPGPVSAATITLLENFLLAHNPSATSRITLFSPEGSGGNVDETLFGATASTFYEYVAAVTQQDSLDYSTALKAALTGSVIGYNSGNVSVWRVM